MVGRGRGIGRSIRVSSNSVISDISDISVVVVGGVLDMLGTTIGKSNIIRSRNNTSSITSLSSVEVSLGVVISNSVLVSVGLISIGGLSSMVSRGSMDYWGMVDNGGSVDNWGMVDNRGHSNSVSNWVVDGMGNWVVDSMGNWVVDSMGNWVVDSMSYRVSNHSMSDMATMGYNSTMSMADHMGRNSRARGSGSKAKKSGNNKSLKIDKLNILH